jgi:hypothetical protein
MGLHDFWGIPAKKPHSIPKLNTSKIPMKKIKIH